MAICLIELVADTLINFQTVVKKRVFASFDELLKCCRQFSIFVSVQNRLLYYRVLRLQQSLQDSLREKGSQIPDVPPWANLQSLQVSLLW